MSYRCFVIISYLRSGTHFLRTALESHPAIICQSELFNSDNPTLPYSLETESQDILNAWVYKPFSESIKQVGFVLQAYHPFALKAFPGIRENLQWQDIWTILENSEDLSVIYLERKNLLRRHLSHLTARQTGQWHHWDKKNDLNVSHLKKPPSNDYSMRKKSEAIEVDQYQLADDFSEVHYWQNRAKERLSNHRSIHIFYEDLHQGFQKHSERIVKFLELEAQPLQSAVHKLEHRSLEASIKNYRELKSAFAGGPWAHYFEE